MTLLTGAACATSFHSPITLFKLSYVERRALEDVACRPFHVKVQSSIGLDWDDDRKEFRTLARCVPHAMIYRQPVFFERYCDYAGTWTCETEVEVLRVQYADRRVRVTTEGVSLTEGYRIVDYFVQHRLFERAAVVDTIDGDVQPPLDNCHIRALEGNELAFKCQLTERRVERVRTNGVVRYRQIPLPWCATRDNKACVYGP